MNCRHAAFSSPENRSHPLGYTGNRHSAGIAAYWPGKAIWGGAGEGVGDWAKSEGGVPEWPSSTNAATAILTRRLVIGILPARNGCECHPGPPAASSRGAAKVRMPP